MRTFLVALTAALLAVPLVATSAEQSETAAAAPRVSPELAARLNSANPSDWLQLIIQFDAFGSKAESHVRGLGVYVAYQLHSIPAMFVYAPAADVPAIAATPGVQYVELNLPIEYDLDTAVHAGNAYPLWGAQSPNVTLNGKKIDGTGVTVAVVDTGVNAMHEDIKHGSKTVRNMMAIGPPSDPNRNTDPFTGTGILVWQDSEDTDGGGHGSHVAGIVAGDGTLSGGKYRGSAPGASLVGLGSQIGSFWYAVAAWDWVFQNHKTVNPPIRIITNSWGYATGVPCDEKISLTKIQKRLVLEADIVMFFSAGNTGSSATGAADSTRTQFKCPWEGNIGVANYFDENAGTRDGYTSNSSSKGKRDDPTTWPDLAAPGTAIMATSGERVTATTNSYLLGCRVGRQTPLGSGPCYTSKSGTSMSTPFAAGVGALLLQVRPDLKPADVEYILEHTAYKYEHRFNVSDGYYVDPEGDYRNHGSNWFRGHGLIDAEAAVKFALTYDGTKAPVVYGANEVPTQRVGGVRAVPRTQEQAADTETPGVGLIVVLVALVGTVAVLRRRD